MDSRKANFRDLMVKITDQKIHLGAKAILNVLCEVAFLIGSDPIRFSQVSFLFS